MRRSGKSVEKNSVAYRKAAERYTRRVLCEIPKHYIGFSENAGFYVVIECLIGRQVHRYPVPCMGASILKTICGEIVRDWKAQ